MKKLLVMFLLTVMLCSCAGPNTTSPVDVPANDQLADTAPNEFYTALTSSDARPIAVMIDNDDETARPPAGLENAYMVYEITVEGAATRLMALFKDSTVAKVGPVRSARHYFLDYVLENDAIYVHAGQSPQAGNDIVALGIEDINGITGPDGSYFARDYTYTSSWHTLYTGTDKMTQRAEKLGYPLTSNKLLYSYNEQDAEGSGDDAVTISLPYAPFYQLSYRYNAEDMVYERYINNSPHSAQSGATLSAKNVVILYMDNYDLNDGTTAGRQELDNKGSGTGYYASNGKIQPVKWTKKSRGSKTVITGEDGNEIKLNPGITYIQIIPESKGIEIK